jgi:hypothetical protein
LFVPGQGAFLYEEIDSRYGQAEVDAVLKPDSC